MTHKFGIGANVYYEGGMMTPGSRGKYKITRQLPVERDNKLLYRIKTGSESFERTAEEHQLTRSD